MYNGKRICWSWRIHVCNRGNNWRKLTLIWKIIPMNFEYNSKNWRANWKHFVKCRVKFFKPPTWIISWRNLRNCFWTMLRLRYWTKHWLIKTRNGRNGGKLYKRLRKNRLKTVWKLLVQMKKPIWMNWLHIRCNLKAINMTSSLANWLDTCYCFLKNSHVQVTTVATSSWNEPVIITTEEPKPIRGGIELAIVSYTLPLPIKSMEIPIVVVNTQVEALEELVTPKPIPLVILEIGVGVEVTLISNISHGFEVLKTLDKN